ncbi:MAG TPA: acyclic terpene utilization AtuA family protein, partial [Syntrophales bacterium]|nr:acyclic terpene utilization AtuA family protein [Syntrophales bacterium]
MKKKLRIGCGAGYAGDRIDPAVTLAERGNIQYLCFECLAERTIAIAQMEKQADAGKGYGQFLEERMAAILP